MCFETKEGGRIGIYGATGPAHDGIAESLDPREIGQWRTRRISQGMIDAAHVAVAMDGDDLAAKFFGFALQLFKKYLVSTMTEAL